MAKDTYTVDYHVICVVYFADDSLTWAEVVDLWTSLTELGNRRARVGGYRKGSGPKPFRRSSKLGASELPEYILSAGDPPMHAGGSVVRTNAGNAVLDSDVNFGFGQAGTRWGCPVPPTLSLSVSGQVIDEVGQDVVLGILRRFMGIADTHAPFFGLVDVAIPTDAFAGSVYGSAWPGNAPLARWVEQENWLWSISQKRDRVRGVYWGNYFGPEILLRLGGKEAFVEKFTSVARSHDGTPDAQCWSFANGVFVSLCLNPQDCRPGLPLGIDLAAQRNLQWLVRELGPAGVLNPW